MKLTLRVSARFMNSFIKSLAAAAQRPLTSSLLALLQSSQTRPLSLFLHSPPCPALETQSPDLMKSPAKLMLVLAILVNFTASQGLSQKIPAFSDKNCIQAIVGEAAGQSYREKLAIAGALRNRGTLAGVYGFRAQHVNHEAPRVWRDAAAAWQASKTVDLSAGATFWEGDRFKKPKWAVSMKETAHVGSTVFYRP